MQLANVRIEGDIVSDILSNGNVQDEIETYAREEFEKEKQKALKQFDEHEVTQELMNPEKGNISMTLGGYGDLFGFIGFEAGSDPIDPVRRLLKSSIKFKGTDLAINYPRNRKGQFAKGKRTLAIKIKMQVPGVDDFDEAAQFEGWNGGRNWVKGIERGIAGASYFADYERGRSERGIQLKGQIKKSNGPALSFKTKKYITKIVDDFLRNF